MVFQSNRVRYDGDAPREAYVSAIYTSQRPAYLVKLCADKLQSYVGKRIHYSDSTVTVQ